jgi:tetratricopeptide (TPR) repeat protein
MQKSLSSVFVVLFVFFVFLPVHAQEERGAAYYDLGVFAYEDKQYEDGEKNLLKVLEFAPDNPFYNHFTGKIYQKMERYEQALIYFNRVRELNPDIPGLKYDTAYLYYKMSDYAKAADLFAKVAKEDPSNVLATYHAGINYFKLNRYKTALDYFVSASEKSPSIKANGYYYAGICFQKTGQIEKAVEKFEYVRDHADSRLLKDNAVKWLKAIESQKAALKPYSLYLQVGYQYDDNVRLEPLDQDFYADEDDSAIVAAFLGSYDVVNRPDYQIGVGYNHYQIWYDTLSEFDLVGSTGNFYARYRLDSFTLGFSYLPTYYWLDDKSYLMRHQLKPAVFWKVDDNFSTRFSYSYYRNNYFTNNDRDGHTHEGFVDAYYTFIRQKIFLFAGIGYEDNTASHADQYYGQLKTRLGIAVELPWELNLGLTAKYYNKEYDNIDSSFGVTRKDNKCYGSASLSHRFFRDWLGIVVEYNHTNNDSNIGTYDYKRNVTTLSLTAKH